MLVAFAQPLRIGDRVTVGEQDGVRRGDGPPLHDARHGRRAARVHPEQPAHGDDDRQPDDPRPAPDHLGLFRVRLGAPVDEARATVLGAIETVEGIHPGQARVLVGDVTGNDVWLTAMASARSTPT